MNSLQRIELISSKFKSDLKNESNQAPTQPAFTYSKLTIKTLEQRCEICSKLTIKLLKRRQWHCFGGFIVNFEHISHRCSSVSVVDFELVITGWADTEIIQSNGKVITWKPPAKKLKISQNIGHQKSLWDTSTMLLLLILTLKLNVLLTNIWFRFLHLIGSFYNR